MEKISTVIAIFPCGWYNENGDEMLYDFIMTDKNDKIPLYRQIYHSVRRAIENGNLKKNDRLPSIRELSSSLSLSKTTVIAAYDQLCAEGYITNRPKSGYFVAADFENRPQIAESIEDNSKKENKYYEYDFSTKSIDSSVIDLAIWRKEIKNIINRSYLLTSYGDAQGEEALRYALQKYALGIRGVNSKMSNIIVGAGTQAVLYLLCSLIGTDKRVALQKSSFVQSEFVFRSFGYEICYFASDDFGVTIDSLDALSPDIILVNPNFSGKRGLNMPVTRRLEMIRWAVKHGAYIIEDDFNGELRYSSHPIPCVQYYDSEHTVYIGSFSKVLLPSVRISYMVLPESLMKDFSECKPYINQIASKTEQLALAGYLNSGKMDSHIRRARRVYLEKSRQTLESIKRYFPNAALTFNETAMYVAVKLPKEVNRAEIDNALEENGIRLMTSIKSDSDFGFCFSGIPINKIDEGIRLVSEIIFKQPAC